MLKISDRPKAAQPIPRVAKTVVDEGSWEYPSVSIMVIVFPAVVITRVTTVRLKE